MGYFVLQGIRKAIKIIEEGMCSLRSAVYFVNRHREVINRYKNSSNKRERKIGKGLDELRKARNDADYNENKLINRSLAERALIMAKQVLSGLVVL